MDFSECSILRMKDRFDDYLGKIACEKSAVILVANDPKTKLQHVLPDYCFQGN